MFSRKIGIQSPRQSHSEHKRKGDAHVADQHNRCSLLEDICKIYFQAHHKHEQQKSQLAEHGNGGKGRRGKNIMESTRKESSEDRRAQQNAGGHFPDHSWLAEAVKNPTQRSGREEHHAERENQLFEVHDWWLRQIRKSGHRRQRLSCLNRNDRLRSRGFHAARTRAPS